MGDKKIPQPFGRGIVVVATGLEEMMVNKSNKNMYNLVLLNYRKTQFLPIVINHAKHSSISIVVKKALENVVFSRVCG